MCPLSHKIKDSSGKRNQKCVPRCCHLLENKSKSSNFKAVEYLESSWKGVCYVNCPWTVTTRQEPRRTTVTVYHKQKMTALLKQPKVMERCDVTIREVRRALRKLKWAIKKPSEGSSVNSGIWCMNRKDTLQRACNSKKEPIINFGAEEVNTQDEGYTGKPWKLSKLHGRENQQASS